jgi:hypothetical protein
MPRPGRIFRREDHSLTSILPTIGYIVKERMCDLGNSAGWRPAAARQRRAMAVSAIPEHGRDARGTLPVPTSRSALQQSAMAILALRALGRVKICATGK